MRLDKFLANKDICSRKEAKKFIKQNEVYVNDKLISSVTHKLNENDEVCIDNYLFYVNEFKYFILNKPQNVVCANNDDLHETVFDLINFEDFQLDLFTVGRLDLDTTGLLLITNDGKFSHSLMSPKRHVNKTYNVVCMNDISDEDLKKLERGVIIDNDYQTLPAQTKRISKTNILLTIQEGKFHQVKRMLHAVDNEVVELERTNIGNLKIPADLKPGDYVSYTKKTLESLIY